VAIVTIDWQRRSAGRDLVDPATEITHRSDALAALLTFSVAFAVAVPFMHTSLFRRTGGHLAARCGPCVFQGELRCGGGAAARRLPSAALSSPASTASRACCAVAICLAEKPIQNALIPTRIATAATHSSE